MPALRCYVYKFSGASFLDLLHSASIHCT